MGVVDLDEPGVRLTSLVAGPGGFRLQFDVDDPDPQRKFFFRIVGVEPRMWDVTGPQGLYYEVTTSALTVRMPKLAAVVEFTEGSY